MVAGVARIICSAARVPLSDLPGSGVRITPGEIALTRTPAGPKSAAHALVRVSIAPLVELYRALGMPRRAIHEPRFDDRALPGGRHGTATRAHTRAPGGAPPAPGEPQKMRETPQ